MPTTNWILGASIDSKSDVDFSQYDKFIGFLVNLEKPRCLLLVSEPGLVSEAPVNLTSENGFFYRNADKNIEIVILDWLDEPPAMSEKELQKFLMEAAVHIEIHSQQLMEDNVEVEK